MWSYIRLQLLMHRVLFSRQEIFRRVEVFYNCVECIPEMGRFVCRYEATGFRLHFIDSKSHFIKEAQGSGYGSCGAGWDHTQKYVP